MSDDEDEMRRLRQSKKFLDSDVYKKEEEKLKLKHSFLKRTTNISEAKEITSGYKETFTSLKQSKLSLLDEFSENINQTEDKSLLKEDSLEDSSSGDDADSSRYGLPVTNHVTLEHSAKLVSTLALDPNGSRLISGGYDYYLKFWDFAGMNKSLKSFRQIEPVESHQVQSVDWSISGDRFLCVVANSQAQLYDREGILIETCVKGDPYINDKSRTKGHVGLLYGGRWHPKDKNYFMTFGVDSTVRLWDVHRMKWQQFQVFKMKTSTCKPTPVTAANFSADGNIFAAATEFGGIYLYDSYAAGYIKPIASQHKAHAVGQPISSIVLSNDGKTVATRGTDDTMKLWDVRSFQKPLHVFNDLENAFTNTDCLFSPDDKVVVTGTSVRKGKGNGRIVFYDKLTFENICELKVKETSAVSILWHPKLNQLLVGAGDGKIKVFYDPHISLRGARLFATKAAKRQDMVIGADPAKVLVHTPNALPLFADLPRAVGQLVAKQRSKKLQKPTQYTGPEIVSKWIPSIKELVDKDPTRFEDPREALLKYKEVTEKDPLFVANAYKETQPVNVLASHVESENESD
ncbi:WD repeat-containing protein 70-like [Zophobas morio]|uniref:WD repeat-containing protein 70-like n=1 Tax=Zophobas morio TaxID=2755281 RepID=UPI0030835844